MADSWHSVYIYYYDTNKDRLFLHCLRPLWIELQENGVERFYFERHWIGGPHVRFHLLAPSPHFQDNLVPIIKARIESYLETAPSTREISLEEARAIHDRLSVLELEQAAFTLYPNNSVRFEAYQANLRLLRSAAGVELQRSYFEAVRDVVIAMMEASIDNPAARFEIGLRLLLTYARELHGLPYGYLFCRSYFEKYLAIMSSDPEQTRATFGHAYENRRAAVTRIIQDVAKDVDSTSPPVGHLISQRWLSVHRSVAARAIRLMESGERLGWSPDDVPAVTEEEKNRYQILWNHQTPYVQRMYANEGLRARMNTDPGYRAHALMVNYLYKLLQLAGINAYQKLALLAFVAQGVEEYYGISGLELIGRSPANVPLKGYHEA